MQTSVGRGLGVLPASVRIQCDGNPAVLLADFAGGAEGVRDAIEVLFDPLWNDPNPHSGSCSLENVNGGTAAATNTCGFYSGDLNAPGTRFLMAGGDLNAIGAGDFQVQIGRSDVFGTAVIALAIHFGGLIEATGEHAAIPGPLRLPFRGTQRRAACDAAAKRISTSWPVSDRSPVESRKSATVLGYNLEFHYPVITGSRMARPHIRINDRVFYEAGRTGGPVPCRLGRTLCSFSQ